MEGDALRETSSSDDEAAEEASSDGAVVEDGTGISSSLGRCGERSEAADKSAAKPEEGDPRPVCAGVHAPLGAGDAASDDAADDEGADASAAATLATESIESVAGGDERESAWAPGAPAVLSTTSSVTRLASLAPLEGECCGGRPAPATKDALGAEAELFAVVVVEEEEEVAPGRGDGPRDEGRLGPAGGRGDGPRAGGRAGPCTLEES